MSLIHHILGAQTMFMALIPFNLPLVFGAAMTFLEISSPFVAARWLLFAHGVMGGDWRQTLNTFVCAVVFILARTVFQIIAVCVVAMPFLYTTFFVESGSGLLHVLYLLLIAEFFAAVAINIAMNVYWSWLIIFQIMRVF
jgi:hypothetical protein